MNTTGHQTCMHDIATRCATIITGGRLLGMGGEVANVFLSGIYDVISGLPQVGNVEWTDTLEPRWGVF